MPAWKASSAFRSMPASARYWGLRGTELERQDPLQGGHAARAELAGGRAPQLVQRLGGGPGGSVDARGQHRVERVGDVDDPGAERDVLAGQPVGVARTVPALVVVADGRHSVVQEAEPVDNARALVGVTLHQVP